MRTKISGSVVLAIPLDLRLARQRLGERAAAAALTGGSDPITLVRGNTAADATAAMAMPLPVSEEWKLARMDLRVVPKQVWKAGAAWRDPTRYAACGMGTALLLVFGLRLRKNRV